MTFTIYPFIHPYLLKNGIKYNLPKDIKDFTNISEKAIKYIKKSPYSFSVAFIIEDKIIFLILSRINSLLIKSLKIWKIGLKRKKKSLYIK